MSLGRALFSPTNSPIRPQHNKAIVDLEQYIRRTFSSEPPQLQEFNQESPYLQRLGQLLNNAFTQRLLSSNDLKWCSLGVRHLLSEVDNHHRVTMSAHKSLEKIKETVTPDKQVVSVEQLCQDKDAEIHSLQIHLKKVYEQNRSLTAELETVTRERDLAITKGRYDVGMLEGKTQEAEIRMKSVELGKKDLESRLAFASSDVDEAHREIKALKEKLKKYKERVNLLDIEKKQLQATIQSKDSEISRLKVDLSIPKTAENHTNAVNEELNNLKIENKSFTLKLLALENEIEVRDSKLSSNRAKIARLNDKLEEMKSENIIRVEQLRAEKDRVIRDLQERLQEQELQTKEQEQALAEMTRETPCVPEIVIHTDSTETIDKLASIVQTLCSFLLKVFVESSVDVDILLRGINGFELRNLQKQLPSIVNHVRKMIPADAKSLPLFESIFGDQSQLDDFDPIYTAFLAVVTAFRREMEEQKQPVLELKRFLELQCEDNDTCKRAIAHISQMQEDLNRIAAKLSSVTHVNHTTDVVCDAVSAYILESSTVIEKLEEELRPITGFTGRTADLPKTARESISMLTNELETSRASILETASLDLSQNITEKDEKIMNLEGKLKIMADTKKGLDEEVATSREKLTSLKKDIHALRVDKKRLEALLEERHTSYQSQIKQVLEDEHDRYEKDLERMKKRMAVQVDLLEAKISEKKEKIKSQEKKYEALAATFDETMKKNRAIVDAMAHQNTELSETIAENEEKHRLQINRLQQQLTEALALPVDIKSESSLLLELGKELDRCFKNTNGWTRKRVLRATSTLINMYLNMSKP